MGINTDTVFQDIHCAASLHNDAASLHNVIEKGNKEDVDEKIKLLKPKIEELKIVSSNLEKDIKWLNEEYYKGFWMRLFKPIVEFFKGPLKNAEKQFKILEDDLKDLKIYEMEEELIPPEIIEIEKAKEVQNRGKLDNYNESEK